MDKIENSQIYHEIEEYFKTNGLILLDKHKHNKEVKELILKGKKRDKCDIICIFVIL